jgi:hypothetical protein
MNTGIIVGILLLVVIVSALVYTMRMPTVKPKVTLTEETSRAIDAALQEEIENTLANVSEAEVEQALLS